MQGEKHVVKLHMLEQKGEEVIESDHTVISS